MSALNINVRCGEVALSAATAKTVLQVIAASNHRVRIRAWGVTFDGVDPTDQPVHVKLIRQTSAIGGSPTAVTPTKSDPGPTEAIQTTAASSAGGSEPSSGDVLAERDVHPQSGYEEHLSIEDSYIIGGSGRVGIVCTAPDAVNVIPWFKLEE